MEKLSDTSYLIDPENPASTPPKKKVRFSEMVTIYKDTQTTKSIDGLQVVLTPQPIVVPLREIVERKKFSMRTQMDQPIQCSISAIIILFIFFLFFTVIVWFVIQKLLLIEIESQTKSIEDPLFS